MDIEITAAMWGGKGGGGGNEAQGARTRWDCGQICLCSDTDTDTDIDIDTDISLR